MDYYEDESDDPLMVCGGEHGCGAVVADTEMHDTFHKRVDWIEGNSKRAYTRAARHTHEVGLLQAPQEVTE